MSKIKIFTALCTGVVIFTSIVPVNAVTSSVTTSSLNNQELQVAKSLESEVQNLTQDSVTASSLSKLDFTNQKAQSVETGYAQKIKNNISKVSKSRLDTLVKKYVKTVNGKATLADDKTFLKLSKDEQLAVVSSYLPTKVEISDAKISAVTTNSTVNKSSLIMSASLQKTCKTVYMYRYVIIRSWVPGLGGFSILNYSVNACYDGQNATSAKIVSFTQMDITTAATEYKGEVTRSCANGGYLSNCYIQVKYVTGLQGGWGLNFSTSFYPWLNLGITRTGGTWTDTGCVSSWGSSCNLAT